MEKPKGKKFLTAGMVAMFGGLVFTGIVEKTAIDAKTEAKKHRNAVIQPYKANERKFIKDFADGMTVANQKKAIAEGVDMNRVAVAAIEYHDATVAVDMAQREEETLFIIGGTIIILEGLMYAVRRNLGGPTFPPPIPLR